MHNKKNTSEQVLTMEDLTAEIEYDNLTQKNNVFLLDDKILSQDNIYDVFLERIVPKIREAFHLMKDNTTHPYSLYNVVKQMEPFLIYHEDITFCVVRILKDIPQNPILKDIPQRDIT